MILDVSCKCIISVSSVYHQASLFSVMLDTFTVELVEAMPTDRLTQPTCGYLYILH